MTRTAARKPSWVVARFGAFGFCIGGLYALNLAGDDISAPHVPSGSQFVVAAIAATVLAGACTAFGIALSRTKSARSSRAVDAAVRAKRLPDDATSAEWSSPLLRRLDRVHQFRWLGPLIIALSVLTAMSSLLMVGNQGFFARVYWLALAALQLAVGVFLTVRSRRDAPVVRGLIAELEREDP